MSATPNFTARDKLSGSSFFKPWTILLGFMLGLMILAWAGRIVGKKDLHPEAVRFHPMIAPDSQYEPTMAEMRAFVRARCRSDQILVIVGGNSILLGVGQPADRVWTKRLQEILGERYAVVNLAFRGASPTDGGALVAESLRDEFPRQIYLANVGPLQSASPIGVETYRFALFDAFYKNLLLPWPPREEMLLDYFTHDPSTNYERLEHRLGARIDAVLHQRDFWNWWSSRFFFTFGTAYLPSPSQAYLPRKRFADTEPDFESRSFEDRFNATTVANDLIIAKNYTASDYHLEPDGQWRINAGTRELFHDYIRRSFPDPVKRRTLILISPNSPYYTRQLDVSVRARDAESVRESIESWEKFGFSTLTYGSGFEVEDFGDRTHLTTSGGTKLAEVVAPKIRELSEKLGYVHP